MSSTPSSRTERRCLILLVPLMVASNVFLLLCMVGLGITALNNGGRPQTALGDEHASYRIVEDHLAQHVPGHRYRIQEWFPPTPLEDQSTVTEGERAEMAVGTGVAQRVKLVFYGPQGAKDLDTVFWIQNGKVTRTLEATAQGTVHEM